MHCLLASEWLMLKLLSKLTKIYLPVQVAFLAFRQVDHPGSASLVDYFQV